MSEWPRRFHPARMDASDAGHDEHGAPVTLHHQVVDTTVTVQAYQLAPATWDAAAAWCGGTRVLDAEGNQAVAVGSLHPDHQAWLGDFIVKHGDSFRVERAEGFYQRHSKPEGAP